MCVEKISGKNTAETVIDYNFSKTGEGSLFLNTMGYSSVKNLFGEKDGNVAIFSNVKPIITKTNNKQFIIKW